jgi:hypothetical protein
MTEEEKQEVLALHQDLLQRAEQDYNPDLLLLPRANLLGSSDEIPPLPFGVMTISPEQADEIALQSGRISQIKHVLAYISHTPAAALTEEGILGAGKDLGYS